MLCAAERVNHPTRERSVLAQWCRTSPSSPRSLRCCRKAASDSRINVNWATSHKLLSFAPRSLFFQVHTKQCHPQCASGVSRSTSLLKAWGRGNLPKEHPASRRKQSPIITLVAQIGIKIVPAIPVIYSGTAVPAVCSAFIYDQTKPTELHHRRRTLTISCSQLQLVHCLLYRCT